MTKVKVFVYGRRRRRQQRRRRRRRGYDNSSPDFRHGELKIIPINNSIFLPGKTLVKKVERTNVWLRGSLTLGSAIYM